jgi:hypothetical protein
LLLLWLAVCVLVEEDRKEAVKVTQASNRHRGLYAYIIFMVTTIPAFSCVESKNKERTNIEQPITILW